MSTVYSTGPSRTTPPVALTIAGSDSGGGAGLQADLRVFAAMGVHGTSAVTAVTAQNTVGVQSVQPVAADLVDDQIKAVCQDLQPSAVKTGLIGSVEILNLVAAAASEGILPNLVVDPVMIATSGDSLLSDRSPSGAVQQAYAEVLFPQATIITPNAVEASAFCGRQLHSVADLRAAAQQLADLGPKIVVIKGGHLPDGPAIDVVWDGTNFTELAAERVDSRNTHGTGCSFASAITAELAKGATYADAIATAKSYVSAAIEGARGWNLGSGHGPIDHTGPRPV